ncbi:MAG: anthranilate synthase component I [Deltaproteobacteria bacterium]|nr:anthranilate synthase component I [Deltaproteobacteria bacterium]
MHYPVFEDFKRFADEGNLIPVYREILADIETPVTALMKIQDRPNVFLLESMEGGEKWGRYTFLGADSHIIFKIRGDHCIIQENGVTTVEKHNGNPLKFLKALMDRYKPVSISGLPRFCGGAVGFFAYDMVRYIEKLPDLSTVDLQSDTAVFLITDTLMIFDNIRHTIKVLACALTDGQSDLQTVYNDTVARIDELIDVLKTPVRADRRHDNQPSEDAPLVSNMTPEAFRNVVSRTKEYIYAGDIIQAVLSQRFTKKNTTDPIDLYRALRYVNPSPYLFFLKLEGMILIGSSPEVMVRLEQGIVELKPIAGTKPRGKNEQDDRRLSDELLNDPKERAEHVMLVDLGRNDLGRIARIGSVQVNELMVVERYSHVMHLVSLVQAQLAEDKDCFDVFNATFPAGTLSGAPKVRAMEIIEELEPTRRGPYGGAVGYFSFSKNMDFCITIRTIMIKNDQLCIQVGAGIVADSDPETEYQETVNKSAAMMQAIGLAASGFEIKNGK